MSATAGSLDGVAPGASVTRRKVVRIAAHAARIALGLIFLVAGVLKMADVAEFAHQTAEYGLIGPALSAMAAPALIAFETTLAVALLVGWRTRAAAILIGAMLVFFISLEAWAMSRGKTTSCGCFGAYVQRTPGQVIAEDVAFLALAVFVALGLGAWQSRGRFAAVVVAVTAPLALGLALASPRLPIDPWVTSLSIGRNVEDLGIAATIGDDARANGLVAILDLTDPVSKEAAAELNTLSEAPGAPMVVALTPSTEEEHAAFLWDSYPSFDLKTADRPVLKRLYRRLPVYFRLQSGKVTGIYHGPRPPAADLLISGAS